MVACYTLLGLLVLSTCLLIPAEVDQYFSPKITLLSGVPNLPNKKKNKM
jgi:hypothetical protein